MTRSPRLYLDDITEAVMRNKIAHEYFGIDHQIIWKTIQDDLPELMKMIKRI